MKNSLDSQAFKFGIIAIVLAAIIPVLAQELFTGSLAPNYSAMSVTAAATA